MARRLVQTAATLCDWCSNLPEPEEVDATTSRHISADKEIDLCGFCALCWDLIFPRKDQLLQMLNDDVIKALVRSAHSLKGDAEIPAPQQLAIADAPQPAKKAANPPKAASKRAARKPGQWVEGVEQVMCPEGHRAGSPDPYWVPVRDRGSHAKSSHHKLGPEVPYKLPDPNGPDAFTFEVFCHEHQVCADAGGYGFKDESGLTLHKTKAKDWPKAKGKDATETAGSDTAAQEPADV